MRTESPMRQIRNVTAIVGGRQWNGSWEIDPFTGDLLVSSAHGSDRGKPGKDPKATAERLMARIAKARA